MRGGGFEAAVDEAGSDESSVEGGEDLGEEGSDGEVRMLNPFSSVATAADVEASDIASDPGSAREARGGRRGRGAVVPVFEGIGSGEVDLGALLAAASLVAEGVTILIDMRLFRGS